MRKGGSQSNNSEHILCIYALQVKAGSIFDNIIVTDDFAAARKFAEDTWGKVKEGEKKMFDEVSAVSVEEYASSGG
jgi:calreticulin